MKWLTQKAKELTELIKQLNKLAVEVIGLIGWTLIIISLLK